MTFLTLLALSAPASAQDAFEPIEKTLPADIPELELLFGVGRVRVVRDPRASQTRLIATPGSWAEDCELRFEGDRSLARVEVVREEGVSLRRCKTDFELVLAGATAVGVEADLGRVEIVGTRGPIAVDLKAGRVILDEVAGPLDVYVGLGGVTGTARGNEIAVSVSTGRIELTDLASPIEAEVALGRVGLSFSAVPSGRVWARTGVGRVRVDFPYGSWLATTLDPGVGRVKSQIPFSDDAYTHLEAATRVGNIAIGTVLDLPGADLATSVTETE